MLLALLRMLLDRCMWLTPSAKECVRIWFRRLMFISLATQMSALYISAMLALWVPWLPS